MSSYCKHCGIKLMEEARYCSSCKENLGEKGNQKSEQISILYPNNNFVNSVLNIIIGFAYILSSSYLFILINSSFSTRTSLMNSEEMNLHMNLYLFIYLLSVLLTAKAFNYLTVSKIVLKVTYIFSLALSVYVMFKLFDTIFAYFRDVNAIKSVLAEYYLLGMDASQIEAAYELRGTYINFYVMKLVLVGISVIGYFLFVTSKYYKKKNIK